MAGGRPIGSNVGLYYDGISPVEPGDFIQTKTGRTYLVDKVRVQERGAHVGRQHIRAIVVDPSTINEADGDVVHPLYWYSR